MSIESSVAAGCPLRRSWPSLAGWVLFSMLAAGGAAFTDVGPWYQSLAKPSWNPPSWVFGPVWTVLYIMMGVAAWLAWRTGRAARVGLVLFVVQWVFNAAWTPIFFGLKRMDLALIDIALLWFFLAATVVAFFRLSRSAGWLLVPYLAWVTFAAALNGSIWRLNP